MTIWILAIVLVGLFATIGFFAGSIIAISLLLGVIVASLVAGPLAPTIQSLMPMIGIKHPLWGAVMPSVFVFVLVCLVFAIIGLILHLKMLKFYKNQRDDLSRMRWDKMNRGAGLALGCMAGTALFLVIGWVVYVVGYLVVQVASDEGNPGWVKFLANARKEMASAGLDRTMASLDNTPAKFYQASDILGLIYHNPILQSRLANYPYFLSLSQRPEFQEIATDKEYNDLIFGKASITAILNHPRSQGLIKDQALRAELLGADLKDLENYLKTGVSSKYSDQKILGRWYMDKDALLTFIRKKKATIKAAELIQLRKALDALPPLTLLATLDNKVFIKAEGPPAPEQPAEATPPADSIPPGVTPETASRYGLNRPPQQPNTPAPTAAKPPVGPTPELLKLAGEGAWKALPGGIYEVSLPGPSGTAVTMSATIQDDELVLSKGDQSVVFLKNE